MRKSYLIFMTCHPTKAFFLSTLLGLSTAAAGQVGIGTTTPHAPLQFGNTVDNRKIVLYETGNNDHQFYGIGMYASTLRYQVDIEQSDHVFYSGNDASSSRELMRIKGNGTVGIGTSTPDPSAVLDVSSNSKAFIVPRLTTQAVFAIAVPAVGMMVYNTDSGEFWGYGGHPPASLISTLSTTYSGPVSVPNSTLSLGQSFVYNSISKLRAIDMDVFASGASPLEMKVRIGTGFSGAIMATSDTVSVSGTGGALKHFVFPTPVQLQAGVTYTFEVYPINPMQSGGLSLTLTSGYANGQYIPTSGTPASAYDTRFVIYGGSQRWQAFIQP